MGGYRSRPGRLRRQVGAASGAVRRWALPLAGSTAVLAGVALWGVAAVSSGGFDAPEGEVAGEVPVTAMHQSAGVANNSPELARDPTTEQFVAAATRRDAPSFGCGLQVSGSGGRGWRPVDPVAELPEGADTCYAPEVDFGANGRLYYLFAGLHGRGNEPMGVFLTSSRDRGRTFTRPHEVLGEHNYSARLAVDQGRGTDGRLYMAWLHATSDPPLGGLPEPPNPIMLAASDDGGERWSEPVELNADDRQRVAGPALAVGPEGTVYVAYYDLEDDQRDYRGLAGPVYEGAWSLMLARSTDGGETFERTVVDEQVRPVERVMLIFTMSPPALAAGADGRVCLAWPDRRRADDRGDILARCSTNRGRQWTDPRRVNSDPAGTDQLMPQLAFAPTGRLDALFVDNRHAPDQPFQHVYYTASHDTGQSFGEDVRVTSHSSSARIGQRYVGYPAAEGKVEFGSRLGLLARDEATVAMWPDTRNSRAGTTGQDLFSARIAHDRLVAASGTRPLWVGGGLVAAGSAALVGSRRRVRAAVKEPAGAAGDAPTSEDRRAAAPREKRGKGWARLGRVVKLATAMAAVGGGAAVWISAPDGGQLPADPPQVEVVMDEDGLAYETPIPPGRVVFRVVNRDARPHPLSLQPMAKDAPPIAEQLSDERPQPVAAFAGIPPLEPGEETAFAVYLEQDSRYALADFSADTDDARQQADGGGYHGEFRTTERPSPGSHTIEDGEEE